MVHPSGRDGRTDDTAGLANGVTVRGPLFRALSLSRNDAVAYTALLGGFLHNRQSSFGVVADE
jgi:hypothetical protein